MKKILVLGALSTVALASNYTAEAQSQTTALQVASVLDARGSARYQALSGAVGAVGTDFGAVHQNPAGLALFRSGNKVSLTGSYTDQNGSSTWYGNETKVKAKGGLNLDELSYMTNLNFGSGSNVTLAFGIQNNGRQNRYMDAFTGATSGLGASISNYAAANTNHAKLVATTPGGLNAIAFPRTAWDNPWLSTLAYTTNWIDASVQNDSQGKPYYQYGSLYGSNPLGASLITNERASASNFDLALAMELSRSFSFGLSASFTTLSYEYKSYYKEEFAGGRGNSLTLDNSVSLSSLGARVGFGLLYLPTDNFRIGASVYTPNFLSTRMTTNARATGVKQGASTSSGREDSQSPVNETSYSVHTPWRFGLSAAYVFDRTAILSADYEYQTLAGYRLKPSSQDDYEYGYRDSEEIYKMDNDAIRSDFGGQHTFRVGLEVNATKRLALRGGFRYTTDFSRTADLQKDPAEVELLTPGALAHYRLPGAIESYSLGLGYRLSPKWTLDVAYTLRQQSDKVAAFPYIRDNATNTRYLPLQNIVDKQVQSSLSASISYRF